MVLQRPRDGADRLHRRAHPQHLAAGHAALGAAEPAAGALQAVVAADDLVHRQAAADAGQLEAVADLDALDRLDAHERGGEPGVEPAVPVDVAAEARRQAVGQHLDDAAEGVALLLGSVDLGDHRAALASASKARTGLSSTTARSAASAAACRRATATPPISVTWLRTSTPYACRRNAFATLPERDPGRRLAGAGALQHRARVVEAVLLHADEVGVAGARAGQGRVAGEALELLGAHRVGAHDGLPLGPLAVADPDGERAALGHAVADPAEELDLVALERHPGAAAVAEPAPGELVRDLVGAGADPCGQPFEDGEQGRPVRLTSGQPTQHRVSLPDRAAGGPPRTAPSGVLRVRRSSGPRPPAGDGVERLAVADLQDGGPLRRAAGPCCRLTAGSPRSGRSGRRRRPRPPRRRREAGAAGGPSPVTARSTSACSPVAVGAVGGRRSPDRPGRASAAPGAARPVRRPAGGHRSDAGRPGSSQAGAPRAGQRRVDTGCGTGGAGAAPAGRRTGP